MKRGYFDRSTFTVTVDVVVHRAGLFFFFLSLSPSPRFLELIVYLVADCFLPPSSCSSREKERERTRENREVEKSIEIREIFIVSSALRPCTEGKESVNGTSPRFVSINRRVARDFNVVRDREIVNILIRHRGSATDGSKKKKKNKLTPPQSRILSPRLILL